jgi:hypothetical protein
VIPKAYYQGSFRKEECRSMHVNLDKKPSDEVAIAFCCGRAFNPHRVGDPTQPPERFSLNPMPWLRRTASLALCWNGGS